MRMMRTTSKPIIIKGPIPNRVIATRGFIRYLYGDMVKQHGQVPERLRKFFKPLPWPGASNRVKEEPK